MSEIGEESPFLKGMCKSMPRLSNGLNFSVGDVAEKITCPLRDP